MAWKAAKKKKLLCSQPVRGDRVLALLICRVLTSPRTARDFSSWTVVQAFASWNLFSPWRSSLSLHVFAFYFFSVLMGLTETINETVVPSFRFTSSLRVHQLGVFHVGFESLFVFHATLQFFGRCETRTWLPFKNCNNFRKKWNTDRQRLTHEGTKRIRESLEILTFSMTHACHRKKIRSVYHAVRRTSDKNSHVRTKLLVECETSRREITRNCDTA